MHNVLFRMILQHFLNPSQEEFVYEEEYVCSGIYEIDLKAWP